MLVVFVMFSFLFVFGLLVVQIFNGCGIFEDVVECQFGFVVLDYVWVIFIGVVCDYVCGYVWGLVVMLVIW